MLTPMSKKLRAAWQRFSRSESGVSAIEFVFVAPVVFLIMGVIIETGFMLFVESSLQASVENASRAVRTGSAQMGGLSSANFKTNICNDMGAIASCSNIVVYVNSATNYTNLVAVVPPILNIGPATGTNTVSAPPCYNPGSPSQPAIIIATYDWYFTSLGMSAAFGNVAGNTARRLSAVKLFQNQPYPGSSPGTC